MTAHLAKCPFTGVPTHRCDCVECAVAPRTKPCECCGCKCRVVKPYDFDAKPWISTGPSRGVKRFETAS